MSTSTVPITSNPTTSKRRLVFTSDDKSYLDFTGASPMSNQTEVTSHDLNVPTTKPYQSPRRKGDAASRWEMIIKKVLRKKMLPLVLLFLVYMVWIVTLNNAIVGGYDRYDSRIAEVEVFVKKSMNLMQVQLDFVDTKVSKVDGKVFGMEGKLEKFLSGNELLSKVEFDEFFEDYKKAKGDGGLDQVRALAKEIVEKEIEKHAADGLGRVDYALASGGASVTKHSEAGIRSSVWPSLSWKEVDADSGKMLRPSFGESGDCFALKGSSGFVEIKLRTAIVPEAVTLEHVAKSVAYDRSSAPKDCKVSGWFKGQETDLVARRAEKVFSLAEFSYDLEKSNAQTFDVSNSSGVGVVDMIRLDYTSNHGSPSHTCIYRFRVHGHEPDSVAPLAIQY